MKKLMIAAVAAFAVGGIFAADSISSANTVGYLAKTFDTTYPSMGGMFISVSSPDGKWCLKDWKVEGMDPASDCLQILNPNNASVDFSITYVDEYYAEEYWQDKNMVGWWDTDFSKQYDEEEFAAEQSFLCVFGGTVSIVYAGEVNPASAPTVEYKDITYPMFCNFLPRKVKYGELTVTGLDPASDFLQILDPSDASVETSVTYVDEYYAEEYWQDKNMVGWWNSDFDTQYDEKEIDPGASFLCVLGGDLKVVFPAAIGK